MGPNILSFLMNINVNSVITHVIPEMQYANILDVVKKTTMILHCKFQIKTSLCFSFYHICLDIFEDEIATYLAKASDDNGHTVWQCIECSYESKFKYNVTEHVRVKHLNIVSKNICKFCQMLCPTKSSLRSHIWRKHKDFK